MEKHQLPFVPRRSMTIQKRYSLRSFVDSKRNKSEKLAEITAILYGHSSRRNGDLLSENGYR